MNWHSIYTKLLEGKSLNTGAEFTNSFIKKDVAMKQKKKYINISHDFLKTNKATISLKNIAK